MMDCVLAGLKWHDCLVYLDDIVVFSDSFDEHLQRIQKVFKKLADANLKLQPTKCKFAYYEAHFLGHIVSKEGVRTDPKIIQAVRDFKVPVNVKGVRSFLGLTGYYRKFVDNFASIAAPLNALLKHETAFEWTEECQKAFIELKNRLVSAPILVHFSDKYPIVIYVDASGFGIGAVLSLIIKGKEHVVAYASRTLTDNEKKFGISEKECLALLWAITYKF
ncbi:Retrovirus-related Pol polyprotein from transposon 17.6-like protein, partial [Leptotrombidium deliense]